MKLSIFVGICLLFSAVLLIAGPNIGEPAPDFTLPDTGYVYHSLSDYPYHVVLINHGRTG
jgi:hypothetical protein